MFGPIVRRPAEAIVSYGVCLTYTGQEEAAMTLRCLHARGACLLGVIQFLGCSLLS